MIPTELNSQDFKAYGQLIHERAPERRTCDLPEVTYWAKLTRFESALRISTGYLIGRRRALVVKEMERHLLTNEVIIALDHDAVLIVGKPDPQSERIDPEGLRAFTIRPGQGVVLEKATWHATPFPIEADAASFFILFADGTEDEDLSFVPLDPALEIET
jgi:ureidoglycolate hydrolase